MGQEKLSPMEQLEPCVRMVRIRSMLAVAVFREGQRWQTASQSSTAGLTEAVMAAWAWRMGRSLCSLC